MSILNKLAIATGGVVVTKSSEQNRKYYLKKLLEFCSNDPQKKVRLPEAAALGALVEYSIRNRNYIVYNYREGDDTLKQAIGEYDIICVFNVAGDPQFGLLRENDLEPVIRVSTPDGVQDFFL